jgi:hypothetical protein
MVELVVSQSVDQDEHIAVGVGNVGCEVGVECRRR